MNTDSRRSKDYSNVKDVLRVFLHDLHVLHGESFLWVVLFFFPAFLRVLRGELDVCP